MIAPEAKRGGIYKRMETIDPGWSGATLDMHGDLVGMQRRIVESSAD